MVASRSQGARAKVVYRMKAVLVSAHFMLLDIDARHVHQRIVHSDFGRGARMCSLLGCEADILQLDVNALPCQRARVHCCELKQQQRWLQQRSSNQADGQRAGRL